VLGFSGILTSVHADRPRDAASRPIDHRAVDRAGSTPSGFVWGRGWGLILPVHAWLRL